MSDFLAIGAVSETLRTLLSERMELPADVATASVTIGTPSAESEDDGGAVDPRVNLFLYRVTQNAALSNRDPVTGASGAYGHPPLSLDLHYLVSAYGRATENDQTNEALAHQMLGSAMRVLHDYSVITESIRRIDDSTQPVLHPSLRGEAEQIKLSLEPISLDDVTKVWTALTVPYRLSAAYIVSVIQIESRRQRKFPRLVGEPPAGPRVRVMPMRRPRIEEVRVRRGTGPGAFESRYAYARIGDTLLLLGRELSGDEPIRVELHTEPIDVTGQVQVARSGRIEILIPDHEDLQPGTHTVRVALQVAGDDPADLRPVFVSNMAVFMLVPSVAGAGRVGTLSGPERIRLTGTRLAHEDLESIVILGNAAAPVVLGDDGSGNVGTSDEVFVVAPEILTSGEHWVRSRVNGAESLEEVTIELPPRVDSVELVESTGGNSVHVVGARLGHPTLSTEIILGSVEEVVDTTPSSGSSLTKLFHPLPAALGPGIHDVKVRVGALESTEARTLTIGGGGSG